MDSDQEMEAQDLPPEKKTLYGTFTSLFKKVKDTPDDVVEPEIRELKIESEMRSKSRRLVSKKSYLKSLRSQSIFTQKSSMSEESIGEVEDRNKHVFKKLVDEKGKP